MKEEARIIKKLLEYYMNCEFEKMPNEMLLSQTVAYSGSKWDVYKHCLFTKTNERLPSIYRSCLEHLPYNCTQNAGIALANHCHWYKYHAEVSAGYTSVWEHMEEPSHLDYHSHIYMKQAFDRYVQCMHSPKVTSALKYCIPKIKEQCESSSIIAAKILRLNLWSLGTILEDHSDWKVVHQIRDPRGVLISQRSSTIMTTFSRGSIIAESSILCDKMLNDTRSFKLYNSTRPRQYMLVKYEEYADEPVEIAEKIYSHLGTEANEDVVNAILELTHASHDSSAMDQHRKNSSETARKWTTKMTSLEKKWIDKTCFDFYTESGYPEDVKLRSESRERNGFTGGRNHAHVYPLQDKLYLQNKERSQIQRNRASRKNTPSKILHHISSFRDDLQRNILRRNQSRSRHDYRNAGANLAALHSRLKNISAGNHHNLHGSSINNSFDLTDNETESVQEYFMKLVWNYKLFVAYLLDHRAKTFPRRIYCCLARAQLSHQIWGSSVFEEFSQQSWTSSHTLTVTPHVKLIMPCR